MSNLIEIDLQELAKHNTPDDCWLAIGGVVFDVTDFLVVHPGGAEMLLMFAGKDASESFLGMHTEAVLSLLPPEAQRGRLKNYKPPTRNGSTEPPPPIEQMLSVDDFRAVAKKTMEPAVWIYCQSAAEDEKTLAENAAAFRRIWFRPKVLVDVSKVDTGTKILGYHSSFPLFISASAVVGLVHPDGEVALCKAAAATGIIQMVPTISSKPMAEIAAARQPDQTQFFQLYVNRDQKITERLIKEAEAKGFRAIFLTVDVPVIGRRVRDFRSKYAAGYGVIRSLGTISDPSLTWDFVDWLQSFTKLPVILKGIQRADDAARAAEHGAAGILLSNNGGRQLDYAQSSLDVLLEVRAELDAKAKLEIYLDGGVRRGSDIFKAVALGAKAVGIARPLLYGLAGYGQPGAEAVINLLRTEFENCMALNGARNVAEIGADMVVRRRGDGLERFD